MLIGITGRLAAGKEILTSFFRERCFKYHETSKILIEGLKKRNIEITRTNMQNLGDEWRQEFGSGVLMQKLLEKIKQNENCMIDSLRNAGEVDYLRENVNDFILIAVDADQKLRWERMQKRGKLSDPKTWEGFLIADERDYYDPANPDGQQVKLCMEKADYLITNNNDLSESYREIEKIWKEINERC